jgi:hypothetical protein
MLLSWWWQCRDSKGSFADALADLTAMVAGPPSRKRFHCDVCDDLRKKDYLYKEDGEGRLQRAGRMADEKYGSSLKTFRKAQMQKSRFPAIFWD